MAKKYLIPIDMTKQEIRNGVFQVLGSAPGSPVQGQFYYDSATDSAFFYSSTLSAWQPANPRAALAGSIANSALATNPLARANHTGTQVAATISDLATVVQAYRLDQFAVPTADISHNSHKITNLANGTGAADAVNLSQLQGAIAGLDAHPSCRIASTANLGLTGLSAIDGVTPIAGDRVLAKNQTTGTQNGVYVAASGAWARDTDVISSESFWFIEEGTAGTTTQWKVSTTGAIVIGTTTIVIVQWGAGGTYTNGNGLSLAGSSFSVNNGLGIIADGTSCRADPGVLAFKYATSVGNGSLTTITITHNLGTTDIIVQVMDASGNQVECDVQASSTTQAVLIFSVAPTTNQYRVVVHG